MIKIELCKKEDYRFIYQLVEDMFKTNLNVTYLKLETFEEFVKRAFVEGDKHYIIKDEKGDRIGHVHIMQNNEIGYSVIPQFRGKGIGTDAVRKIIELNSRERYFLTIHNDNIPSVKLAKKLGFIPKGTIFEKIM